MAEIVPSILVKEKGEFDQKIQALQVHVSHVHLDIADGIFVNNKTIDGYPELVRIDNEISFDVHLMVSKPENHITHWKDLPVEKISFHIEATKRPEEVINAIKEFDISAGVVLNPKTSIDDISRIIDQLDFVQFMTVEPGFYGSEFVSDVVEKIKEFHFLYPDMDIAVDGGVNPQTAPELVDAGATTLIVGSYLFKNDNIEEAIEEIENALT